MSDLFIFRRVHLLTLMSLFLLVSVRVTGQCDEQWLQSGEQGLHADVREHAHRADEGESFFHFFHFLSEFGFLAACSSAPHSKWS